MTGLFSGDPTQPLVPTRRTAIGRAAMRRVAAVRLQHPWAIALVLGVASALGVFTEAIAQVSPANDGTGTQVTQEGDRFTIEGGTLSADGQNLFHSLQEFGLSADEIATFMSNPDIQNILSRVVGGEASFIDGLIEVAGGDSNLFLINPAGIIFGSNARLDVPADFTATTATGIGFADGWFDGFGDATAYGDLVGDPTGFRFTTTQSGAIANGANLSVGTGQSLTLLGGTVINTGTLSAPGGSITIAAVPGEHLVRISYEGMVLNLEMAALSPGNGPNGAGETLPFTPLSLPDLLTGSNAENATGIEVNPDGTVSLSGSGLAIPVESGTAIASGNLDVRTAANRPSNAAPAQIAVAGDRVAVLNGQLDASTAGAGGLIRVGGNFQGQGTDGEGTIPNSQFTYVDGESRLSADGLSVNGGGAIADGGQVIIWSDGTTQFAGSASARAGRSGGDGGLIEVSGRENLTYVGSADTAAPNGTDGLLLLDPVDITIVDAEGGDVPDLLFGDAPDLAFVEAGAINASVGDVILQASRDISVEADINTDSVDNLILQAGRSIDIFANITLGNGSFFARINDEGANPAFRDAGVAFFTADDAAITTIDGDITIDVGTFNTIREGAVDLFGTTILSATNGDISINGFGADVGEGSVPGIQVDGATIEALESGRITLNGAGAGLTFADFDNNGVEITDNAIIRTTGTATLDITGTAGQGTEDNHGVLIENSAIEGGGGDISITGSSNQNNGSFNNSGILISGSTITNAQDGSITLTGAAGEGVGASDQHGVAIIEDDPFEGVATPSLVAVENGTLSISGQTETAELFSHGIFIDGSTLDAGPNGEILLRGEAPTAAGILAEGSQINIGADSSRIVFTTDELDFIDTSTVEGSGELLIQPFTPGSDIQVGGVVDEELGDVSDDNRLTLNTQDLASLTNGFSQVIIGRANGSGLITIDTSEANLIFQDPTLLRSPTGAGSIDTRGGPIFAVDEAALTLLANQDILTGNITVPGGTLSITSLSGSIDSTDGLLSVADLFGGGDLTLSAARTITTAALTASAESSDGLEGDSNDGGTIDISAGQTVRLEGAVTADAFSTTTSGNGGTITVDAGDELIINAPISASSSVVPASNGGTGDASTGDAGNGGQIALTSGDRTEISGSIAATSTAIDGNGGSGGSIRATAGSDLAVNDSLTVESSSAGGNAGAAGQIDLNASNTLQINAELNADSTSTGGNASSAGRVRAAAGTDVSINAALEAASESISGNAGNGGTLEIEAGEDLVVSDRLSTSTIAEAGNSGNAGSVALTAGGDIQVQDTVVAESRAGGSAGNGGVVQMDAGGDLTVGDRLSSSSVADTGNAGNAGPIGLRAGDNLQALGPIEAESSAEASSGNGGFIRAESGSAMQFSNNISSRSQANTGTASDGGRIELRAGGALQLDAGATSSSQGEDGAGSGGSIRLDSSDTVDVADLLNTSTDTSSGTTGTGGRVRITADNDITLNNIDTSAPLGASGGGLRVNSRDGSLTINTDVSSNGVGDRAGGRVSLRAGTDISITLTSLTFSDGSALDDPTLSTGGSRFSVNALGNLTINGEGDSPIRIATLGGTLRMRGISGIEVNNVILDSSVNPGNGGTIRLLSPNGPVNVGDLDSSGETGGNIVVRSRVAITAGAIDSSGSVGDGGNVLLDPPGDVEVAFINAQGGDDGRGGTVDITTGSFFRATDTFLDRNGQPASISTIGGISGGDITIRHGGNGETPFDVGDGSVNGTAAAITSGDFSIQPFESFPFTYILGNISILTGGEPPVTPPPPVVEPPPELEPDLSNPGSDPEPELNLDTPLVTLVPGTVDYETVETVKTDEFTNYWGLPDPPVPITIDEAQDGLRAIEEETGIKPAILYAFFVPAPVSLQGVEPLNPDPSPPDPSPNNNPVIGPEDVSSRPVTDDAVLVASAPSTSAPSRADVWIPVLGDGSDLQQIDALIAQAYLEREPEDTDELELILVTSDRVVRRRLSTATRAQVQAAADTLRSQITSPIRSNRYLGASQTLYNWLVTPLEQELDEQQVDNIAFVMDVGLRSVPIAALHDGERFIIENYSVGLMPTLSLTDTRYADIRAMDVLAMGAAEFSDLPPLPAVPVELEAITQDVWQGVAFIDSGFSIPNLLDQRRDRPYGIVHLATHGEFQPGDPSNSYIQFGQQRLALSQLRDLSLNDPPVELMVLSACRTALGDEDAELGFAGLAVQAGVKSALASLWYVSDTGTLAVMTQFYQELQDAPIKAEALRQAQLDLLNGENRWIDTIRADAAEAGMTLSDNLFDVPPEELAHPYYWSAFTMIGSPW